ncbi:uncharacterized protein SOCEGT47_069950 [Sorangium cellulosum]|uniref:Secreted protein n=2 Tax=Sorangium cellulosum TaxID=56 RepID=A0A4P2QBE7_SORCE|nr:uncharacterized protein SOCEGT47_069950 [Sorangium cellulosum]
MKAVRIHHGISGLLAVASFSLALGAFTGMAGGAEDAHWESCNRLASYAARYVEHARSYHLACSSDVDCILADPSTDCQGMCFTPINRSGLEQMRRVVSYLNKTTCREHRAMRCPYATPACLATRPVCARGTCAAVP